MLGLTCRRVAFIARSQPSIQRRWLSKLESNPNIYVFPNPNNRSHILSLLPTEPPTPELILGESNENPPSPRDFKPNQRFLQIVHSVIGEYGHQDPQVQGQAAAMASSSGATLMQVNRRTSTGSAGASDQGGAGSGGQGGYIHVSDNRHPPDYGRIAEPEDIFGSLEVNADGTFTDTYGHYQQSGTYRLCTNDGVLGLPDFLMKKLVERLKVEEAAIKNKK